MRVFRQSSKICRMYAFQLAFRRAVIKAANHMHERALEGKSNLSLSQAVDIFVHDKQDANESFNKKSMLRGAVAASAHDSFKAAPTRGKWRLAACAGVKGGRTADEEAAGSAARVSNEPTVPGGGGAGPYNPFSADGRSNAFLSVLKESTETTCASAPDFWMIR